MGFSSFYRPSFNPEPAATVYAGSSTKHRL
jgi:hypothetical protein